MYLRPAGESSSEDEEDIDGFSIPRFSQKKNSPKVVRKYEETPFDIFKKAIFSNNIQEVANSLDKDIDINVQLTRGWTALMQACQILNVELLELLLERGANPNISYEKLYPIIVLVKSKGDEDKKLQCLDLLLKYNSKYNCFDQYDKVPLMYAIKNNFLNIVNRLLSLQNININHIDKKGQTALITAVKCKQISIVVKLIDAGAIIDIQDNYSQSAYDYAKLNGSKEILKVLGKEDELETSNDNIINSININFQELFLELPFYSRSAFRSDIINFLYGICDPNVIFQQDIEFDAILAPENDSCLKNIGLTLSFSRNQILENIKYFHLLNWEREPLVFMNRKQIDLIDLMNFLYNLLRTQYFMTSSVKYLIQILNADILTKSQIDSIQKEIAHCLNTCEICLEKINTIHQKVLKFKSQNTIQYGDLIRPMKKETKTRYKFLKYFLFLSGISLSGFIFFRRSLKY